MLKEPRNDHYSSLYTVFYLTHDMILPAYTVFVPTIVIPKGNQVQIDQFNGSMNVDLKIRQ